MDKPCNGCEYSYTYKTPKTRKHMPGNSVICSECMRYKDYDVRKREKWKYEQGEPIKSMADFEKHIADGCMFFCGKAKNVEFLASMQYQSIASAIDRNLIFAAIRKQRC